MVQTVSDPNGAAQTVPIPNGQSQTAALPIGQIQTAPAEPPVQTATYPPQPRCPQGQTVPLTAEQQDLVVSAMPIATRVARTVGRQSRDRVVDQDDLAQTAMVTLCRAAQRWDRGLGVPFGAYAFRGCKRVIRDVMNERLGVIALPRWLFRQKGVGHANQALVTAARRVGGMTRASEPESVQAEVDDWLDAEELLAWLLPEDRALVSAYLGGETIKSIAARSRRNKDAVSRSIKRILGDLKAHVTA